MATLAMYHLLQCLGRVDFDSSDIQLCILLSLEILLLATW